MSQCVNKIILAGFLGATPELRFTVQGKPVCNFNIAVDLSGCGNSESPKESCIPEPCGSWRGVYRGSWKRCDMGFQTMEDSQRWPDDGESSWRGPSRFRDPIRGIEELVKAGRILGVQNGTSAPEREALERISRASEAELQRANDRYKWVCRSLERAASEGEEMPIPARTLRRVTRYRKAE